MAEYESSGWGADELIKIGVWHRRLHLAVAALILITCFLAPFGATQRPNAPNDHLASIWALAYSASVVFATISIYKLLSAMRSAVPILYAIGVFAPCVNFLVMWSAIRRGTLILRDHGIRIGILGASPSDLAKLR